MIFSFVWTSKAIAYRFYCCRRREDVGLMSILADGRSSDTVISMFCAKLYGEWFGLDVLGERNSIHTIGDLGSGERYKLGEIGGKVADFIFGLFRNITTY